ncbi:MAG: hypothetical protein KFF73_20195, partial [Cyclobacteriaceae bacterium]|nr:hypothetical protein [Cyclobacteriaceae bacterium]
VIDIDRIIDLTGEIDSTGNLRWRVPEGQWILLESGMIPTGATNVPVPAEATGYECDKFTEAAIETHFNAFVGKFLERVPADERKSFKTVVIDSYEVGPQNWTDDFRDVFRARFGYDPIPWLPVFGGHIVKSMDLSNRFLWDVRRLTADLIADVYVRRLREMSNEHGLELWMENYGHWGFPAEFLQYGGQADQVSGEFWFENHLWDLGPLECRAASSAAHTYGKKEVFAEAFTAGFNFLQYPAIMKSRGDQMFCEGINHFVQHVYIHQPWENRKPGVTAWFGMAYQRHNTWFGQSRAWNEYLQRCHFLLQQGLPVSDVCYFIGEDTPKMTGTMFPSLPAGFDFDFINADAVLNRLSVRDGALVLPDGKSYQLLILPPLKTMRPELLKKFGDLIGEGASIYGSPPTRSPSMENYPEADEKVKILAGEIWGETDGKTEIGKTAGSGRLFNRDRLEMVFKELDLVPDMICKDSGIHWTHRKQEDTDIYFLSNPDGAFKSLEISFRVTGKIPELWDPATGKMEKIAFFDRSDSRTSVPLNLDPHGSVFIIFREPVKENHIREMEIKRSKPLQGDAGNTSPRLILTGDGHLKLFAHLNGSYFLKSSNGELKTIDISGIPDPEVISGPWKIVFPGNRDVPVRFTFDSLISWTDHPDPGVRHFSGTGQYNKSLILPESMIHENSRLILDLGKVRMMAEVAVNGKDLGILWKEPFCVDITSAVRAGKNDIEIRITNTWWNRLVGDEKYPMGFPEGGINQPRTWTTTKAWNPESDLLPSGLLGPVRLHVEKEMVVW